MVRAAGSVLFKPPGNAYNTCMTKVIDAIFSNGVLRPIQALNLPEQQRVRLIVQTIDGLSTADRQAALKQLRSGIARMDFRLQGSPPARDELHDRT
jgi:predicted DNA-binding antitoxin AbrB/MazE fold protein